MLLLSFKNFASQFLSHSVGLTGPKEAANPVTGSNSKQWIDGYTITCSGVWVAAGMSVARSVQG